jgi:hypothetical protein
MQPNRKPTEMELFLLLCCMDRHFPLENFALENCMWAILQTLETFIES